ncbi:helix-turn-helix domain-containing protein [Streptosporangium sp. CA-115845]|uniref:helix-turn-helix domain-containing protein n=1 Tax=Streptosporangium sp. CA-115845 TaxID=3240071 RepID=UPI003D9468D3
MFQLIRQYAGVSQTRIGTAVNLSQGKISEIMRGTVKVTSFEVFERVADGLDMPDPARLTLGLAPRRLPAISPHPQRTPPSDEAVPSSGTGLLTPYLASLTGPRHLRTSARPYRPHPGRGHHGTAPVDQRRSGPGARDRAGLSGDPGSRSRRSLEFCQ